MIKRDTPPNCLTSAKARAEACVVTTQDSAGTSADGDLNEQAISMLIAFFKQLDEWDREVKPQ